METSKRIIPFIAVPPIGIVKDEIEARGISQKEFAERLGMKASNMCRMFKTGAAITVPFARKLEAALGIPADSWLRLQAMYEEDVIAIKQRNEKEAMAVVVENALSQEYNMAELYDRLGISPSAFIHKKLDILKGVIGFEPALLPSAQTVYAGKYKKSDVLRSDAKNMRTWNVLAYIASKKAVPDSPYVQDGAVLAAMEIARKAHNGNITEAWIKETLSSHGISYSYVPALQKAPIDAYSSWVNEYPSIVTTHRHNDMDMLVFNIIHELGHIQKHLRPRSNLVYVAGGQSDFANDPKEREANRFAEDMIIPAKIWKGIMNSGGANGIGAPNIVAYLKKESQRLHLDFGLVMWRYKFETSTYAYRGIKAKKIV